MRVMEPRKRRVDREPRGGEGPASSGRAAAAAGGAQCTAVHGSTDGRRLRPRRRARTRAAGPATT